MPGSRHSLHAADWTQSYSYIDSFLQNGCDEIGHAGRSARQVALRTSRDKNGGPARSADPGKACVPYLSDRMRANADGETPRGFRHSSISISPGCVGGSIGRPPSGERRRRRSALDIRASGSRWLCPGGYRPVGAASRSHTQNQRVARNAAMYYTR